MSISNGFIRLPYPKNHVLFKKSIVILLLGSGIVIADNMYLKLRTFILNIFLKPIFSKILICYMSHPFVHLLQIIYEMLNN